MERTVLMIRAEQRIKLQDLATQERVSAAEIHRRAIDAYNPHLLQANDELEQLAEVVLHSSKAAAAALNEARKAVKDSLAYFAKKGKKK